MRVHVYSFFPCIIGVLLHPCKFDLGYHVLMYCYLYFYIYINKYEIINCHKEFGDPNIAFVTKFDGDAGSNFDS